MRISAKRVVLGLTMLVGAGWSYGAAAFLAADGSLTWTLPCRDPLPAQAENLASFRFGPTLRASSFHRDEVGHHHPVFLIDGKANPTEVEKWCSSRLDPDPWIEISWPQARSISTVKIWHAGFLEPPALTTRRYRLSCLSAQAEAPVVSITSNDSAIATHALPCKEARGIRIDWTPNLPGEPIRVYEIEAW